VGTFTVAVEVGALGGDRFELIEAIVDTGASHSIFPEPFLRALGIEPQERQGFRLADERQREFGMSRATIRLYGRESTTWVAFGDAHMPAILGAVTLEDLRLAVDPVGRRLVPTSGLLMTTFQALWSRP
jgi:predicted aspartyl protease